MHLTSVPAPSTQQQQQQSAMVWVLQLP
jgi:hypothetical protein